MQDAGCRIGPKMDSSAWCRMQDAECAGCKIRPKELVRRVPASCILHRVQGICGF